jgi:hypothetical protein
MTGDRGPKRVRGEARREAQLRGRAGKKAKRKLEELGPERRLELAQQIEAKRFRGKPPSI